MKSLLCTLPAAALLLVLSKLEAAANPVLTRGPYLQRGASSEITIRWRTDVPTDSEVRYGASSAALSESATDPTPTTEHEIRLTALAPATQYSYTVGSTSQTLGSGSSYHFQTAPMPGVPAPVRVWVLGDSGTANATASAVRNAYAAFTGSRRTDVILMLGDNAYENGTDAEYQAAVFAMYPSFLRNTVLWPAIGNHDLPPNPSPGAPYFQMFTLPADAEAGGAASGTEKYYSFDYANVHFVCLDSHSSSVQPGSAQLQWLAQDLAETRQTWIIAYWHHPPYTRGGFDSDTDPSLRQMREHVLPVLENGGVDMVFSGHAHTYERSFLLNGHYGTAASLTEAMKIDAGDGRAAGSGFYGKDPGPRKGTVYLVPGSSGKVGSGTLNHPIMTRSLAVAGSVVVDVIGEELLARFLDKDGVIRDEFGISKAPLVTLAAVSDAREADGHGSFSVSRNRGFEEPLTVALTIGGSATSGADYAALPTQVVIPAGESSVAVQLTPHQDAHAEGPETVLVTAQPGIGYRLHRSEQQAVLTLHDHPADHWRFVEFGGRAGDPAVAGDAADPDSDGHVNLIERAMGTEPLVPTPPLQAAEIGGYPALRFSRAASARDLTWTVQISHDLEEWHDGSTYSAATSLPTTPVTTELSRLPGEPELITVRTNVPVSARPQQFLRLRITSP